MEEHLFWTLALVSSCIVLLLEAAMGYTKQYWYYSFGLPVPFTCRIFRSVHRLESNNRFYVKYATEHDFVVRYRLLGNFSPSLTKAYFTRHDELNMRARVTFNWWVVLLFVFAVVGVVRYGKLLLPALLVTISVTLLLAQIQELFAFVSQQKAVSE
jgi:hypothetical protein